MSDFLYVPVDAVPKDVLGVDSANEKLEDEFPMAHTEQYAVEIPTDIGCLGIMLAVRLIQGVHDRICKCCKSKAEAEDD